MHEPQSDRGDLRGHDAITRGILETVREPLLILDDQLCVEEANRAFYKAFNVRPGETHGRSIFELGNCQWDIAGLRTLLEDILPGQNSFEGFRVEHDFDHLGRKTMLLNARRLDEDGRKILLAIEDVTDRVRTEAAMNARDNRWRDLFSGMAEGFFLGEILYEPDTGRPSDFRFLELNRAFGALTGLTVEETAGRTVREAIPGIQDDLIQRYARVVGTGKSASFDIQVPALENRWYEVRARHLEGPKFSVLFLDITGRKEAEAEHLRLVEHATAQARIYESVLSNTPDFMYVIGLDHRFLYANEALLAMWGRTRATTIGRGFTELGYPEWHAARHDAEIDRVIATRKAVRAEVPFTGTGGERIYDYIFAPVLGPNGEVVAIAGSTRDVTERTLAADRLRESEQQLRQMTDALPQQVWTARSDGYLDYVNAMTRDYAGEIPVENGVVLWTNVVHPDDLPHSLEAWGRSLATGEPYEVEQRVIYKATGEYRWHLSRARPFRNASGQITRWFGTNTDIDDRKRSEAAAAQSRDEAQAANRMKDDFLATLSHELRTPLNAILGWAKILGAGPVDQEDLEEGIAAIERNSIAQVQIIEDLLDISRIVSGNFKLEVQRVNIQEIIEAAIATVMPAAAAKQIPIHKLLDSLAGPVSGDPARLQQVVWNLLTNAVKFTPKGGHVHVLLERVNSHIEIGVVDTGMGIRPEFLPHVFDRFRQADSSTTRRHGGLGLGLAIVRQLVEIHGGSVRVKSPGEGQGSTFTVALPITVVHPEQAIPGKPRPKANEDVDPGTDHVLKGVRVLVLDDEPDARRLLRRVLTRCDAEVAVASSAAEGLNLVESFRPDVIVSDVGMPDQDGYDFIRKVRANHSSRDLPAAALTAFARAEDRKHSLLAGFQTHVAKPVDPAELVAVVASLAGKTGRP